MSDIKNLRTIEEILQWFKDSIDGNEIIQPSYWVEAALKLLVLMGSESDKLYAMQQEVAQIRAEMLGESDATVSGVKIKVEATDRYRMCRQQEALLGRIEEFIRLAKLQARLRQSEMNMN